MDRVRIDDVERLREKLLRWKRQRQCLDRPVQSRIGENLAKRIYQPLVERERLAFEDVRDESEHHVLRQGLTGFPTVERIGVMRHQEGELVAASLDLQLDRGGKTPRKRDHRPLVHALERKQLLGLGELDGPSRAGNVLAVGAQQA